MQDMDKAKIPYVQHTACKCVSNMWYAIFCLSCTKLVKESQSFCLLYCKWSSICVRNHIDWSIKRFPCHVYICIHIRIRIYIRICIQTYESNTISLHVFPFVGPICIPHISHRIPHTAYLILHTSYCIPHTAYRILHTAYRIPYNAHIKS